MADSDFTPEELAAEEWRPVAEAETTYAVSDLGRVRSEERVVVGRDGRRRPFHRKLLRTRDARGYEQVLLWVHGRVIGRLVHRLVVAAFVGEIPRGLTVNHIDGVKWNNRRSNLELVTPKENCAHAIATGLMPRGDRTGTARLTNDAAVEIVRRHAAGERSMDLAAEFGIARCTVAHLISGRTWSHVTGLRFVKVSKQG